MNWLKRAAAHPLTHRLIEALLTLIGVSVFTFALLRIVPGDQITAAYGTAAGDLSPEQMEALRSYYGLDKPLVVQYFDWLGGVFTGNLGVSTVSRATVASMTAQALPNTIELAVFSILIAVAIGVPLGLVSARKPGHLFDSITQGGSLFALSVPSFLFATALSSWLANTIGWYPNGETYVTFLEDPVGNLEHLILPAFVLGFSIAPPILQTTRASVLSVQGEDFVRTVRAKGVPERRIRVVHVLRNALIPVVTMTGMQFGFLLGGALVCEQIFAIPGVGRQMLLGLNQKDYAVVQSTVLIIAALFVLVNFLTDLLYRLINPKVRAE